MSSANRKKNLKLAILQVSRATGITALGRLLTRSGFNIIGFHGVSLEDEHERFPTLFISPDSFERRLRFLSKHYQIVSLQDALEQHRARRIRPNQVVLTFDDGFYNFLGRAMPILKQYQAPATVYVVTAEVESGEPAYNLLARDAILSTRHTQAAGLPDAPDRPRDLSTLAARNALVQDVLKALSRTCTTRDERLEFCHAIGRVLDVDVEAKLRARLWNRLTPAEVRQVVAEGFDMQLHTHSHRNVVENRQAVRNEILRNRQSLERLSEKPAVHFCYPLGLWDRDVWADLTAEGVQSAATTRNGPNYPDTPALSLRRYLTGEAMTDLEFEFGLSGVRWLARMPMDPTTRYRPSEKRVRYQDQPELY
jgi:peptidoglycan/xylan/chitin deacetylase (PgdA/CDA1 family)